MSTPAGRDTPSAVYSRQPRRVRSHAGTSDSADASGARDREGDALRLGTTSSPAGAPLPARYAEHRLGRSARSLLPSHDLDPRRSRALAAYRGYCTRRPRQALEDRRDRRPDPVLRMGARTLRRSMAVRGCDERARCRRRPAEPARIPRDWRPSRPKCGDGRRPAPRCSIYGFDLWLADYGGVTDPGRSSSAVVPSRRLDTPAMSRWSPATAATPSGRSSVSTQASSSICERRRRSQPAGCRSGPPERPATPEDRRRRCLQHTSRRRRPLARLWQWFVKEDGRYRSWEFTEAGTGIAAAVRVSA